MKIAFVNDAFEKIGVEYIAAVLKRNGHTVKLFYDPQLFDDENMSLWPLKKIFSYRKKIVHDVVSYKPDVVAFSVVSDFYSWASELAFLIKKETQVPIIFGGIHPTSVPEHVIMDPSVDVVCVGEGEYPFLEFVQNIQKGKIDYSVSNLWFKVKGKIIKNPIRPLISHLDMLPFPDKDLFFDVSGHFQKTYFVSTGRGCPFECSYCYNSFARRLYEGKGFYVRRRSPGNVIEELALAKKRYKINFIRFNDDTFTYDIEWIKNFATLYKQHINLNFSCFAHPNTISEDLLVALKNAGCCEVEIGVQTFSEKIRQEVLNRFTSTQQIERAIALVNNSGMQISVNNMLGIPWQTEEEIQDLARFYNKNRVGRLYMYGLRYYPRTNITEFAYEKGILSSRDIERIEQGEEVLPFTCGGHAQKNKEFGGFMTLFALLPYLPSRVNEAILKWRLYKIMPSLPYHILILFTNWFRIPFKYNWMLRRTIIRYPKFMLEKIFSF